MTERIRQSLGGLCLAAPIGLGALVIGRDNGAGAVLAFIALLIAVVCLLNLGLDLVKPQRD
ncbi:hypothetical protein LRP67_16225 [Nocardioides sp. cx-169]|uniref:hypothetical protein n=1 Tax=Nocardioides sp. cx-169 TaxID=2899080 RepID=UPI001E5C473A|nr:hypothetical protein [Nocardioides sp. cx-169]MCD4535640.1 hypothetical protein [Nocardioides sp. cx-169]